MNPIPLRWTFDDTKADGRIVSYFRDADERCVRVTNPRIEVTPQLVDTKPPTPIPVFDAIEINGTKAAGDALDRMVPKVMRALYLMPGLRVVDRFALDSARHES